MSRHLSAIGNRLSLRAPQRRALEILADVAERVHFDKHTDPAAALAAIQAGYPTVTDFERAFPSLCFALATGVGKTRLMGAFIAFLHLEHGIDHFFVLAPNLTIYNKLVADFTPNTPKYVFTGIAEFAGTPPEIVTGDNYESGRGVRSATWFSEGVHVNIFNISKINSEVRGGKAPRIRKLREYIGESYFDYLSKLDDLVLLMDESHRYRGSAGVRVLNELRPILGLELTATPHMEEGNRAVSFKNVIYDYPLAMAMKDGFVKEPAVATRENFRAVDYTPDHLERLKLEDGVRLHENAKVELEVYARTAGKPVVKPFMLVVARDVEHANALMATIQQVAFFNGQYKDRVITVHSNQRGEEKDETIEKLLSVESAANATEIVIHVNMLKEGWDVTNLYTIVPLRAADSKTLVEQSIGRGLRLPYGQRVGVPAVDRLTIVAHDRFQAIVDEANKPGWVLRVQEVVIGRDVDLTPKKTLIVQPVFMTPKPRTTTTGTALQGTETERKVMQTMFEVIRRYERDIRRVPKSSALTSEELRQEIAAKVSADLAPQQPSLPGMDNAAEVTAVINQAIDRYIACTIDIPRIVLAPVGEVTTGYDDFDLDLVDKRPQPVSQKILIQHLSDNARELLGDAGIPVHEARLEDYLIRGLIDFDDVCYDDHADLLYKWCGQVVRHLQSYLSDEDEVRNVLLYHQRTLVNLIHSQMLAHRRQQPVAYEAHVSQGFEAPKEIPLNTLVGEEVRDFRAPAQPLHDIPKMIFGGFRRCVYPTQKFGSNAEKQFAILLEDETDSALKWFKPVRGQFKIWLRDDEPYEPDFVVETTDHKYLCEPKRADEIDKPEVRNKARVAIEWCKAATEHERKHGGKPWRYLLIPHDAITASMTLAGLAATYTRNEA
jgi:type III restriction enzyme